MVFGYKISGRLAISNLFQVVSLVVVIPLILKYYRLKDYILFIWLITLTLISGYGIFFIYDYFINASHFIFFTLSFLSLQAVYVISRKEDIKQLAIKATRLLIMPTLLYLTYMGIVDIFLKGAPYSYFGFDDKSHAVIVLCFYAFVSLSLMKSNLKFIASVAFMILAFLTGSRLVFIFVIFYISPLLINLFSLKRAKNYLNFYFRTLLGVFIITGVTYFIVNNPELFKVLERVTSQESNSSDSTQAHMYLIKYGILLKMENVFNFIFGVTPGGFASVLANSKVNFMEFGLIDPRGYLKIFTGETPMHSTLFSFYTEFSVVHFIFYLALLTFILKRLIKCRLGTEILFFAAMLIATTFYSSNNELFFYFILFYLISMVSDYKKPVIVKKSKPRSINKKSITIEKPVPVEEPVIEEKPVVEKEPVLI